MGRDKEPLEEKAHVEQVEHIKQQAQIEIEQIKEEKEQALLEFTVRLTRQKIVIGILGTGFASMYIEKCMKFLEIYKFDS